MIDTIQIKHFYRARFDEGFLNRWHFLSNRRNPTWTLNAKGAGTLPGLTMINTPDGIVHLSAEVSLPKMVFGHNARLPNQAEVSEGLQMIGEYIEAECGLPFDVPTATVSLVHFAKDICLTESDVWKAIGKLSAKKLPRMKKNFYEDSTLYFTTKARTKQIRIYPKLQEVLDKQKTALEAVEMAKGVLRFEYCLLKRYSINSLVKKLSLPDKTTESLLTQDVSDFVMSQLLESLNFNELLTNNKTNLDNLLEKFPTRKAMNLSGFLEMINQHGELFYKDETLGFSKDSYFRDAKDCRKAKVWKQAKPLE